ncbi:uncharacterized protein N7459_001708 [Penicillium hispanicum]|uniref:uncharacterized protein n=1 Tax=Penicillium hispanicum TaxID=1080232 RepID=UPI0025404A23|nr:uncharacterized protein N7459_001708 [Penicillium hispanicum]KAJ5595500.1 hypothetical protein N7459_001708 [Penicillium hispanicum]
MRFFHAYEAFMIFVTVLSFPTLISGSPHPEPPAAIQPSYKANWGFELYSNRRCTGDGDSHIGTGSSGCRTDITTSFAQAFVRKNVDSHCTVTLYKDSSCSKGHSIGIIHSDTTNKCKSAGGKKKRVKSYEVMCS